VALCADLIGSLKMEKFIEKAPERFVQTGIAEANMMGIAAGLLLLVKFLLQEHLLTLLLLEF
jgi:transketolase